ncbi:MAG: proline dehydrogenase family protein [Acidobacteriota bacterium]
MGAFNRLLVTGLPVVPKPLVGLVAKRYVAGETLDDAVAQVRDINGRGAMATLDVLGEEVRDREKARAFTEECLRVLDRIHADGVDSNLSIKPTMFGLGLDEAFCRENVERIAARAKELGNFVRIDMEDASTTDATLRLHADLHERYGNVGCVLQAYMRRTLDDIDTLPEGQGVNVRLCKGIYIEPRRIAWKGYETVRHNFVAALDKLFRRGVYVGIATHDEYLVCAADALIDRYGLAPDRYEFQMLLGVEEELRDIVLGRGHRLRIYTPYGREWYAYSLRRLRENPEIAGHVARAFVRRRLGRE